MEKKNIKTLILGAMGCIVLYWLLHETERMGALLTAVLDLIQPFLVGACVAFILNVPMRAIERELKKHTGLKSTRGLSIILTFVLIILLVTFVVYMLIPQIGETFQTIRSQLPPFIVRMTELSQRFFEENPEVMEFLEEYTDFEHYDWAALVQQAFDLVGDGVVNLVESTVSAVGSVISAVWGIFVSLVFAFYCLGNKEILARQGRRILYAFVSEGAADEIIRIFRLTNSTFSSFISGQCIEVTILGSLFAVVMSILRMPYVPLVSVLVAITAFIPVVGAWVGCILGAFFILVNNPIQALTFVVMFLILQQIENNLIYPRVVGTSIGLPSMWVLVAVSIGGNLMGVGGMLVMIPLVSVLYTLLREYTGKRVSDRNIPPEKLMDQPPELKSKFREKREASKKRREAKRAAQLAEMMKQSFHFPEHKKDK